MKYQQQGTSPLIMSSSVSLAISGFSSENLSEQLDRILDEGKQYYETRGEQQHYEADRKHEEDDFYEKVDQRMSANSFEYTDQQAKKVSRWLRNLDINSICSSGSSLDLSARGSPVGNIVGIRGYHRRLGLIGTSRAKYKKLKLDYSRLLANFERLRMSLGDLGSTVRAKGQEVKPVAAAASAQQQKPPGSNNNDKHNCHRDQEQDSELARLRLVVEQLELKLTTRSDMFELLERQTTELRLERDDLKAELTKVRAQSEKQQLESAKKQDDEAQRVCPTDLQRENAILRSRSETDQAELSALRADYMLVEDKLKSLLADQKLLGHENGEQTSKLLTELCRLQVYQPRLEHILDTERAIKQELLARCKQFEVEIDRLKDELGANQAALSKERLRTNKENSVELDRVHGELNRWRDKYQRLASEKADSDELVRLFRSKLDQNDKMHDGKLTRLHEEHGAHLAQLASHQSSKDRDICALRAQLEECEAQASLLKDENQKLETSLRNLSKELELANGKKQELEDSTRRRLEADQLVDRLRRQIGDMDSKSSQLRDELALQTVELDQQKRQVNELKRRVQLQQKAYEQMRETKDRDLAKLRVNLNLEQYNRQIALESIEKELRSSVRQLESMKCRFKLTREHRASNSSITIRQDSCSKLESGEFSRKPDTRRARFELTGEKTALQQVDG